MVIFCWLLFEKKERCSMKTQTQWIEVGRMRGAFWSRSGCNKTEPHIKLTSDLHSDGYFVSELLTTGANDFLDEISDDLIDLLVVSGGSIENVDKVVGPAK